MNMSEKGEDGEEVCRKNVVQQSTVDLSLRSIINEINFVAFLIIDSLP